MKKINEDKSSSEILRQKAEELFKEKSEAKILELIEELAFQNEEKAKRADELLIANKELAFQNKEKTKRADELVIANKELGFQNEEKAKRADELLNANKELAFQNEEKAKRADELFIANKELIFQNEEKAKRADELLIANKELDFQNEEKAKRSDELLIANKELAFQNEEKAKRADALLIANKELASQNKEKTKRADELFIANKELAFQNEEKAKRAAELFIANKELAFQNEEKAKRADELRIANKELAFQAELIVANNKAVKLTVELELYQTELEMQNKELSCAKEKAETDARKYAELYDNAPSGYFTLSNDGTITLANNIGATMLGKDRSQIKDNRFGFFVSNDTLRIFNLFLVKVFSGNANETCDVTLLIRGNLPMYVHLTGIASENGKECLLTVVDITESRMMVELHQSEQRYHALVDWSPYAVIVHRNLKIVYANPAAIMMFGAICAQDLVGTKILDRIHPDCHQIVQERIRRGIEHGIDAVMSEFKYFKLDGTIIIAEAQGTTITYDGVPCILASMRDITERTRIENLLHDTNLKLDLAMDMAGTGWWEMDIPTGSVIFSKHNSEMLGYAPESFKHSRDLTNLIHPEDYDRTMNAMQGHLNGLFERYEVEYRIKTKSGEYIWFYDIGSVVKKDANGKPLTVSGIVINTTARKHAEHEIEQSHARFSAMISNISDVIAIMDADGFKKYESPNLKKHFGWLPEDNAGRSAFSFIHPDDMEYALKDFYSVLGEDRSVKTMEFRFECKDGSYKPIELTASNLLNDPLINGIMVSFRDITDRKIAEETLRENDARYSSMISNISDVIGIMGADGIMTYKSSNIEKWFGWLPQDRVGTSGFSTVHPDDMEYVGKVFYSLLEKDNAIAALEFRYQCKDGSYKPIELTAANLLNDPYIHGVLLNYRDITERKQKDEELRKSEEIHRSLFEISIEGMVYQNPEGTIVNANPAAQRILGLTRDQMQGRTSFNPNWRAIKEDGSDFPGEEHPAMVALKTGKVIQDVIMGVYNPADEIVHWIKINASPLFNDGEDAPHMVYTIFEDITYRKQAEDELRQSHARYTSMISNIADVIVIMDADGVTTYKSSNLECMFGWLPQDHFGTSIFSTIHPDDLEATKTAFHTLILNDKSVKTIELRFGCKNGSYKPIELTASNQLNDPAINGVLMNFHDITERKQAENKLLETNQQLESAIAGAVMMAEKADASNKSKSTFLANMSHEIRTPLNAIIGFSQLMNREKSLTDSQRKYVTSINSAGEHLLKLINDILELSKLGAGRMEINPTNFDLHAVFNEVQMMFKELSLSKRLQLVVELSGDLPHDVIADSHKLRQILINLIGNAIKFTDKGSIFVRASVDKRNKDTSRLVVEIQDTGPGISEDELGKLFKQFEQTSAGILKNSGTGLGLALSRELAVLMGGNITVASEEGKGSVFTIHVVLKEGKSEVSEAANAKRVICIDNPQKAYRVLVVDDKQENRQVVVNLLNLTGFETKEAVNGEDAIAKFEAWEPHLILMDMRMPVMDGFEAIRLIKSTEKGRHTPVIAVTASTIEDHEKKGFNLDIQGCILKPFHENELFSAIGSVLGIEYIYEEEKPVNALSGYPDNAARLDEDLAKLPDDLILLMLTAVKSANLSHSD